MDAKHRTYGKGADNKWQRDSVRHESDSQSTSETHGEDGGLKTKKKSNYFNYPFRNRSP